MDKTDSSFRMSWGYIRDLVVVLLVFGLVAFAQGCGGGGGGNGGRVAPPLPTPAPPPPPPPSPPPPPQAACDGFFPGMAYEKPDTSSEPPGVYLASSDGCRSELVFSDAPDYRGHLQFFVTSDLSEGVLVWREEPGNNGQYVVNRLDFEVAPNGALTLSAPEQILPRPGEGPAVGDNDVFRIANIWGAQTADSLFLFVSRSQGLNSASGETVHESLIYDLNDLTVVREEFRYVDGVSLNDCPVVSFPQFVPECYLRGNGFLNASGTRLYFLVTTEDDQGMRWDGLARSAVDTSGPLTSWTIADPEIVFTAPAGDGPGGGSPRPGLDRTKLPNPEILSSAVNIGSSSNVFQERIFLNADNCVSAYAPFADGTSVGSPDLWMQCVDNQFVIGEPMEGNGSGGGDWQSPDTVLNVRPSDNPGIYRFHISGAMAGLEELLIENGQFPDTGL